MASVKIILRESKQKSNGETPLYIRIIKNRKITFKSTGIYIDPKTWNPEKSMVRGNTDEARHFNAMLKSKIANLQLETVKLEDNNPTASIKAFKNALRGLDAYDFIQYAENFILGYERKGKIGTYNRFKSVVKKLKDFVGEERFSFANLTVPRLKEYEAYMRKEYGNSTNTIHANFRAIKRIVNEAITDDIMPVEKNPFLKFKVGLETIEKIFLTEDEMQRIENLPLIEGSKKYHHRNMYVFACYAGGVRISDLITMKWSNFDGTHLNLNTKKTNSVVSIKLPTKALAILNLYKTENSKANEYIFPFIDNDLVLKDPKMLHKTISSITAYTNTDLRDIAKAAKIEKHIHFHTSRHTWATLALKKGMRIEYVSKLMGHTSIKTTQVYAKIVNADLDKAMDVFEDVEPVVNPDQPTQ